MSRDRKGLSGVLASQNMVQRAWTLEWVKLSLSLPLLSQGSASALLTFGARWFFAVGWPGALLKPLASAHWVPVVPLVQRSRPQLSPDIAHRPRGSEHPQRRAAGAEHLRRIFQNPETVACSEGESRKVVAAWRMDRLPTPVFLGFPGSLIGKESTCNVGDLCLIPG